MKKKKAFKIVGISLGILILVCIIGTCCFTGVSVFDGSMQMVNNKDTSIEKIKSNLKEKGFDEAKFESEYKIEKVQTKSTLDGHTIPADYITVNGNKNADTVVMVHGMGGNRLTVYPVAKIFLKNGYNVLAYDQRSSGENTVRYTTYGYWESHDLSDYVAYVKKTIGNSRKIGVWGVSFGGATVGIYLGSEHANQDVDFAIMDCPISNMSYMLSTEMEQMKTGIPVDFMMLMGNITTKIKLGFSYNDVNVCNYTRKTNVPVLIINSKADKVTPYQMGKDIYDSIKTNNKKLFTVSDSKHADVFDDHPNEYENNVIAFIKSLH